MNKGGALTTVIFTFYTTYIQYNKSRTVRVHTRHDLIAQLLQHAGQSGQRAAHVVDVTVVA